MAREITAARRAGTGVYVQEWTVPPPGAVPEEHGPDGVIEPLLSWCRETLGRTRRPWGIAHFDLTVTIATADGRPSRTLSFERLEPGDLYPGDSLLAQLRRFLVTQPNERLAATLFSWGDAAHAALPQS